MNALHHSPLATSNQRNRHGDDHETPVIRQAPRALADGGRARARRHARHAGRWLSRRPICPDWPRPAIRPHPDHGEVAPFFTKTGEQIDCDYVVYRLRFGARGDPAKFLDPDFIAEMQDVRIDFRDTLPAGLEIVDVQVSGDGTDAGGGPLPAPTISTVTNPNDTVTLDDFRAVDQRSRRVGRDRSPLRRLRHHGEDRPCGLPGADDRRQPGLRRRSPASAVPSSRFPRTIRRCRTTAISRPASRPRS